MIAISDASPLILYSNINRLDILQDVFSEVQIPAAVWTEVVELGLGRAGTTEIAGASWIQRRSPIQAEPVGSLNAMLGPGESEVIALAAECSGTVALILDDRHARAVARQLGYSVVGSAGVLTFAKRLGVIERVSPLLGELKTAGLYLSASAMRGVLASVGESSSTP